MLVRGNLIGTNLAGTAASPNDIGVLINGGSTNNTIGGNTPGTGNIISGNSDDGVEIADTGTSGNVVVGDYIGTDITGTVAIANGTGVEIDSGASDNTIGGTIAAARNIIAGNRGTGIGIDGGVQNVVEGNYIGLDSTGSAALGNGRYGVEITAAGTSSSSSSSVSRGGSDLIGGTAAGSGNVISGNAGGGIFISGGSLDVVAGNLIGTDATGTVAIANGGDGVRNHQRSLRYHGRRHGRGRAQRDLGKRRRWHLLSREGRWTSSRVTSSAPTRWGPSPSPTAAMACKSPAEPTASRSAARRPVRSMSSRATSMMASR